MSRFEKVKKIVLISLGFALATYLIMSGLAILDNKPTTTNSKMVLKQP